MTPSKRGQETHSKFKGFSTDGVHLKPSKGERLNCFQTHAVNKQSAEFLRIG